MTICNQAAIDRIGQLKQKMLDTAGGINVLPSVATRAMEFARDPNCRIDDFAQVIHEDVKLAAEVLRLANSSLFNHGTHVFDLKQAVVRLGCRQVKNLIVSSCALRMMRELSLGEEWIREILVEHSVHTASLCTRLNHILELDFQGEEYAAGLLHDFGRTLLATVLGDEYSLFDALDFEERAPVLETERAAMGTDHAEIGAWFATEIGLPHKLVLAIQYHHTPLAVCEADDAAFDPSLIALVKAGDDLANHMTIGTSPEDYEHELNTGIQELVAIHGNQIEGRLVENLPALFVKCVIDSPQE